MIYILRDMTIKRMKKTDLHTEAETYMKQLDIKNRRYKIYNSMIFLYIQ